MNRAIASYSSARTTILIAARNAVATIGRAVRSACAEGDYPILLIDDYSEDGTADAARAIARDRLTVVRSPEHGPLGLTRQTGLLSVATPYAVWLDADDELLPGRVSRLVEQLHETGADIATDAAEIVEGGHWRTTVRVLPMPSFLRHDPSLAREFERNYLPVPGAIAFRTDRVRALGYDVTLHGAEDIDLLLRASAAGFRFALVDDVGYRIHAIPDSQSRQLTNQRAMYRRALLKHRYESVEALFIRAGYDRRTTAWALVSMAAYRDEPVEALAWLEEVRRLSSPDTPTSDPQGPAPWPERWRQAFWRGTLLLRTGDLQGAHLFLSEAERIHSSAEGANNLGVVHCLRGESDEARHFFAIALARAPHYFDATLNFLGAPGGPHVTTHPFRAHPNRSEYSLEDPQERFCAR